MLLLTINQLIVCGLWSAGKEVEVEVVGLEVVWVAKYRNE